MRSLKVTQSETYSCTLARQSSLKRSMPISFSISNLPEILSFFSTSISTGRPCVSQPAFRSTKKPFIVL